MKTQNHNPRFVYDCGHCKFSWNCGPLCSCVLASRTKLPEDPARKAEVELAQEAWRVEKELGVHG